MAGEKNTGKKTIYASIGGKGDKLDNGIKVGFGRFTKRSRGLNAKVCQ